jgi:hypothetical protein
MMYLAAQSGHSWTDGSAFKVVLPFATAVLGFVSSYVLELFRRKREIHKQISWNVETEQGMVSVSPSIQERVRVLYQGNHVDNLHAFRFVVTNSGNRVVKDQHIRFEFKRGVVVLDDELDPKPPREIGALRIFDPALEQNEIQYKIEHLERRQQVNFLFLVAGTEIEIPALHPYNKEGDVDFVQRDSERVRADSEHVRPFLSILLAFIVLPPMVRGIWSFQEDLLGELISVVIRAGLAVAALPHIPAITRLAQRIIANSVEKRNGSDIEVKGNAVVLVDRSNMGGDVHFGGAQTEPDKHGP